MSPFMSANKIKKPILLIHGEEDNNSGTLTMQSDCFFNALKGHGALCYLVILPFESHGHAAQESIIHVHLHVDWKGLQKKLFFYYYFISLFDKSTCLAVYFHVPKKPFTSRHLWARNTPSQTSSLVFWHNKQRTKGKHKFSRLREVSFLKKRRGLL